MVQRFLPEAIFMYHLLLVFVVFLLTISDKVFKKTRLICIYQGYSLVSSSTWDQSLKSP